MSCLFLILLDRTIDNQVTPMPPQYFFFEKERDAVSCNKGVFKGKSLKKRMVELPYFKDETAFLRCQVYIKEIAALNESKRLFLYQILRGLILNII
jgi:hypothetical protein